MKDIRDLPCPPLDANLVRWLDARFPEKSAEEKDTIDSLKFKGGQVSVVRLLKTTLEEQEKLPLKGKIISVPSVDSKD